MESFLEELQLVLPVIGVDFFRKPHVKRMEPTAETEPQVRFVLDHASKGINAKALEVDGEFVVLSGAIGSLNESVSFKDKIKDLRDQALSNGLAVRVDDKTFVLTQDLGFTSPSAAAIFLFGTSRNGRTDWMVEGTKSTYGAWSEAKLLALAPQ